MHTDTSTEQVTIGRADYGTQQTVTVVHIEGVGFYRTARGQVLEPCGRCSVEAGSLRAFSNVLAGVCFACTGRGWTKKHDSVEAATKVMQRRAKEQARRDAKAAAKAEAHVAQRDAAYTSWVQANPELAATLGARFDAAHTGEGENAYYAHLDTLSRDERTVLDFAESARWHGGLTDKQNQSVTAVLARIDAQLAKAQASHHIGAVGEKVTVTGTVVFTKVIDGMYGSKVLVKVEDGTGGTAVMFTTAQWAWEVEDGAAVTIAGTVKDHTEYQGVAQTVLNRPKLVQA